MSACRYRVMVVDDDPALLRLLSMRLSAVGYEVAAVESGEKADLPAALGNHGLTYGWHGWHDVV